MTGRTANVWALALLCLGAMLAAPTEARTAKNSESEFGGSVELGGSGIGGESERSQVAAEEPSSGAGIGELPGYKGAPQQQQPNYQDNTKPLDPSQAAPSIGKYPGESGSASGQTNGNNKGELLPMFNLSEYAQLIFSPFELAKKISEAFKLPQEKFIEKIGKGLVFGAEALLTPIIASLKIIEKVFVPDHCRLKLLCQIGSKFNFVKETVLKFSPKLLHGSHHLKALSDGITGQNCEIVFKDCEPKLKKPYEDLKTTGTGPY